MFRNRQEIVTDGLSIGINGLAKLLTRFLFGILIFLKVQGEHKTIAYPLKEVNGAKIGEEWYNI